MTANHYSLHLRTMWSSVPETVPIGVATPASKHIGVVGASFRGLFPLLMMSASGTNRTTSDVRSSVAIGGIADMAVTSADFRVRPIADNRLPLGGDAPPATKAIVDLTQWAKPGGEGGSGTDRGATQRGAAQAVGLAGPMNAPMKKTARRVK